MNLQPMPVDRDVATSPAQEFPLPLGEGQGEGVSGPPNSTDIVDIVIADVPYGIHSTWSGGARSGAVDSLWLLLEALRPVVAPNAIVAIASDKSQRPRHAAYARREWFQVGKRRVELLSPTVQEPETFTAATPTAQRSRQDLRRSF
jgi:hypothetical protein